MLSKIPLIAFFISLVLVQCKNPSVNQRPQVNIDSIELTLGLDRFEQELFESDSSALNSNNAHWLKKYPILYPNFMAKMLNQGMPEDPMAGYRMSKFIANEDMRSIYQDIQTEFGDFSPYYNQLKSGFKRFKHHFKDSTAPLRLVTFYSNFNAKTFPTDTILGIGLDFFLGPNNAIIKGLDPTYLPQYLKNKMKPQYLVSESLKHWLHYTFNQKGYFDNLVYSTQEDFLSTLVFHGKMVYTLSHLLPNSSIADLLQMSPKKWQWAVDNEAPVYRKLIEDKLLYSQNQKKIKTMVAEGPFTNGYTEESPAGLGVYLGYKMVENYASKKGVNNLQELMDLSPREILRYYRP